jgi:D-alanyl-D-alanine carboxypeptidase
LRYPAGKEKVTGYANEPWHYRFVGVAAATAIWQGNLTLEEYLGIA